MDRLPAMTGGSCTSEPNKLAPGPDCGEAAFLLLLAESKPLPGPERRAMQLVDRLELVDSDSELLGYVPQRVTSADGVARWLRRWRNGYCFRRRRPWWRVRL